jgi:hypothetical protein
LLALWSAGLEVGLEIADSPEGQQLLEALRVIRQDAPDDYILEARDDLLPAIRGDVR